VTIFIDRSNVNGVDDYRVAPVTHLYLKVTEGVGFVDTTYAHRRVQGLAAHARIGGYHFAALQNPIAECDFFLEHVIANAGGLRPCLDLERGTVVSDKAWAEAWISHFKSRKNYLPTLYGSTSLIAPLRASSALIKSCPWWRAEYGPNDGNRHPLQGGDMGASAHQYTSVAHVPGISGNTDQSAIIQLAQLFVPEAPRQPKKWPRAHHYDLHYTDKFGDRQMVQVASPRRWQMRHPLAQRRPPGVHPVPRFKKEG